VPNSTRLWKLLKIAEFRTPTLQDVREKGSKILKPPSVRNCFTLAMTYKLVVIINGLKVPKIKKLLLYEMKFLVPNYSCLQNPWLGRRGLPPPDPRSLSSALNWISWHPPPSPQNKIPGYATDIKIDLQEVGCVCMDWIDLAQDRAGGGLLWLRYWTFGFHKMRITSWLRTL